MWQSHADKKVHYSTLFKLCVLLVCSIVRGPNLVQTYTQELLKINLDLSLLLVDEFVSQQSKKNWAKAIGIKYVFYL